MDTKLVLKAENTSTVPEFSVFGRPHSDSCHLESRNEVALGKLQVHTRPQDRSHTAQAPEKVSEHLLSSDASFPHSVHQPSHC